jgi:hypothetical protein
VTSSCLRGRRAKDLGSNKYSNVRASSVSSIVEYLCCFHNTFLAVSYVLGLTIAHRTSCRVLTSLVLTPNADEQGLLGLSNTSTTASLSAEYAKLDTTVLIISKHHVLLVANSYTAFLSTLPIAIDCFHEGGVFIAHNLLGASCLLWLVELIGCKLELRRSSPGSSIMTIHACILVYIGQSPVICGWVEEVLNLMDVSIPRHLLKIFIEFK